MPYRQNSNYGYQPRRQQKGPCYKCGKMGHFARECWQGRRGGQGGRY